MVMQWAGVAGDAVLDLRHGAFVQVSGATFEPKYFKTVGPLHSVVPTPVP